MTHLADSVSRSFRVRSRRRVAFIAIAGFLQLLSNFAFFATNIAQMTLEKRQLRFLRIRLVTHRLALSVLRAGLFCFADLVEQVIFLSLKFAVACLQSLGAICRGLLFG